MSAFWDERFAGDEYFYGTRPNAFLAEQSFRLTKGSRLLVPGDGEGRNGVWLAEQGMTVHSVDGSAEGVAKARRLAAERGIAITTDMADLTDWSWPTACYDAVIAIFLHLASRDRAALHAKMLAALRPGGLFILEAFRPAQLAYQSGGPRDVDMLYTDEQLKKDFQAGEILLLDEPLIELDEGPRHSGTAATIRLVARKV